MHRSGTARPPACLPSISAHTMPLSPLKPLPQGPGHLPRADDVVTTLAADTYDLALFRWARPRRRGCCSRMLTAEVAIGHLGCLERLTEPRHVGTRGPSVVGLFPCVLHDRIGQPVAARIGTVLAPGDDCGSPVDRPPEGRGVEVDGRIVPGEDRGAAPCTVQPCNPGLLAAPDALRWRNTSHERTRDAHDPEPGRE